MQKLLENSERKFCSEKFKTGIIDYNAAFLRSLNNLETTGKIPVFF